MAHKKMLWRAQLQKMLFRPVADANRKQLSFRNGQEISSIEVLLQTCSGKLKEVEERWDLPMRLATATVDNLGSPHPSGIRGGAKKRMMVRERLRIMSVSRGLQSQHPKIPAPTKISATLCGRLTHVRPGKNEDGAGAVHGVAGGRLFSPRPADQVLPRPDPKDAAHRKVGGEDAAAIHRVECHLQ